MSRLRVAVAVVSALLLAPLPGATAAPAQNALTITGSGHGTAEFTITESVVYNLSDARADYTGGDYAGFAIGRDVATVWAAAYNLGSDRPAMTDRSWADKVLRPGRYVVYFFADEGHPATITLPWDGPTRVLQATKPLAATVDIEQVLVPSTTGTAGVSIPQTAPPGANLSATAFFDSVVAPSMTLRLCQTRDATTCAKPQWSMGTSGSGTALNGFGLGRHQYPSRTATRGTYVRGEISGTNAGLLTLVVLRYPR